MLLRTIELMSYHSAISGLVQAQDSYPHVDFRYIIQPEKKLPSSILPISFNHKDIKEMINLGAADAVKQVQLGKSIGAKQILQEAQELFRGGQVSIKDKEELLDQYLEEFDKLIKEKTQKLEL